MSWFVMAVIVLGGAIAQDLLPTHLILGHAKWPVLLSVTVYYAMIRGFQHMMAAAVAAGILQAGLGMAPSGISSLCFCAIGTAAWAVRKFVALESAPANACVGAAAGLAHALCLSILLQSNSLTGWRFHAVAWKTAGAAALGAVCMPVCFKLMLWLDRFAGNVAKKDELSAIE